MAHKHFQNLRSKIGGDRRDQRAAIREAGFADESEAAAWARSVLGDAGGPSTELEIIQTRPSARRDSQTSRRLQRGLVACSATPEAPRPNWKSSRLYVERGLI